MNKTKYIIISLLALAISTATLAQAVGEKFKFQTNYYLVTSLDPPTVAVTCQYSGYPSYWDYSEEPYGEVVIRSSVTYKNTVFTVTAIGNYAFHGCSRITSILIPESVISFGFCSFKNCSSLISINIPDSLTFLGSYTFGNCTSLTSIVIPDKVTFIGSYTFFQCYNLTYSESVKSIDEAAFGYCVSLTSITLPESVYT